MTFRDFPTKNFTHKSIWTKWNCRSREEEEHQKKGTIEQLNLHVDETKWLTSFFVFFLKRLKIVIKICVCEEDISWLCLLKDFNLFTEIIWNVLFYMWTHL